MVLKSLQIFSRAHDSGTTADIPSNQFENTDSDTSSLVTFLKKEFSVSQDEASLMAVILKLERTFGETLKPSDIIYIKLRTLDWLSYELEINDNWNAYIKLHVLFHCQESTFNINCTIYAL